MTTVAVHSVPDSSLFLPDLKLKRKESVLHEMACAAQRARVVRDADLLHETLLRRERWCPSAVGKGVAVPNARSLGVTEPRLVVARFRRGLDWGAQDDLAVQLVLLVISPSETSVDSHLERVARAIALTRSQRNRQKLLEAEDGRVVGALLRELAP
jgi:mannitol/fructose-specific phosphotransferase system IIA component (Ntr-type)